MQACPPRRKMVLLPRDCFKTSIAQGLVIHMTIQPEDHNIYMAGKPGCDMRILYCAETSDRAETRINFIRRKYEENRLIRAFWGDILWEDPQAQKAKWNSQRLLLRRKTDYPECTIERTGVDAAITGGHFDAMVKDDLISIKARNEPTTMRSAIEWDSATTFLFDSPEHGLEWYFGTRWGAWDLYTSVEKADKYDSTTGEGVWLYQRSIIEEGQSIFPERHTLSSIDRMQRKSRLEGTEDLFYLNMMNTVVGSKMQDFRMSDIRSFEFSGDRVVYDEDPVDADLQHLFNAGELPRPGEPLTSAERAKLYKDNRMARLKWS
jgi:hypothetical protein